MCGIVGFAGEAPVANTLVNGLRRLEYRGYDSAGLALITPRGLELVKAVGPVEKLAAQAAPVGNVGLGHTRWATHGRPTERNAHPHADCKTRFAVVHNGIIENYAALRDELTARGHEFRSETDTEILAHLIEEAYDGDLAKAVRQVTSRLEGSYAVAVVATAEPDTIVAARLKSPLLVGLADTGVMLASDATAVVEHTKRVVYLEDGDVARLRPSGLEVFDASGKPRDTTPTEVAWSVEDAEKGGFDHFMLKEIHEIPRAVHEVLTGRLAPLASRFDVAGSLLPHDLLDAEKILITACGTSFHAGLIGKNLVERLAGVPVEVQLASEYRYGPSFPGRKTLALSVSQSGETADTLEALRKARLCEHRTLSITNVVGSTMTREADGVFYIRAGPEIGVAATKTFVNTVVGFYQLALHLGVARGHLPPAEFRGLVNEVKTLPRLTQLVIDDAPRLRAIAEEHFAGQKSAFFLGRQLGYGVALEGALKLKEISYLHAEGYAAGELKHGPLALLEEGTPVVVCAPRDNTYGVITSNIGEVRARGANVLAITDAGNTDMEKFANVAFRVPQSQPLLFPIPAITAMYLLSYYAAKARGCAIDKPRNLAKSVTVE